MGGRHRARGGPRHPLCVARVLLCPPATPCGPAFAPLGAGATEGCVGGRRTLGGPFCPVPQALLGWGEEGRRPSCPRVPPADSLALQQLLGPVRWRWEVLLLDFAGEPSLNLQLLVTSV